MNKSQPPVGILIHQLKQAKKTLKQIRDKESEIDRVKKLAKQTLKDLKRTN